MSTEAPPTASAVDHPPGRPTVSRVVRSPVVAALGSALVATAVVLPPLPSDAHRLVRDFVAVPTPAAPESLLPATATSLRAWPLDAVSWAAAVVVPTGVQQVAVLVLCLVGAGVGAGLLVAPVGRAAAAAAAWVAVWNPYVTERLLLGQVPTLLGYACLPWIVVVGRSRLPTGRRLPLLLLAAAPAALTPWGGVLAVVAAVVTEVSRPDRKATRVALVATIGLGWCLPWLLPTVLAGGLHADPDGAAAFAVADDSSLGTWLSAAMGGGVWATGAQPSSRSDPAALTGSLVLVGLAVAGVVVLATRRRPVAGERWRGDAHRLTTGPLTAAVAALALLGPASMAWWASGPGLDVVTELQQVPGMALLRDQHRMLAPAVLAQAVLAAFVVGWLARLAGRVAAVTAVVVVIALAVASVPDLRGLIRTAYRPVTYPAEWNAMVDSISGSGGPPTALSLPWQPLRRPVWAGDPAFLDPLPRAVHGTVLTSTTLSVRRDGSLVVVDDAPMDEVWASGEVSAESLRRHAVTHVVEWLGTPGALASSHDGWRLVHSGPHFRVWHVTPGG